MKKSTLFLIVLTSIFFTSTIYLLFLNFQKPTVSAPQNLVTPRTSESPSLPKTKSYKNIQHNFEIEFPGELVSTFEELRKPDSSYLQTIHSPDYKVHTEEMIYTTGESFYYLSASKVSCSNLTKKPEGNLAKILRLAPNNGFEIFQIDDPVVSRYSAKIATKSLPGGYCLEISCYGDSGCADNKTSSNFDQILSSFKFSNITPINETPFVISESNPKFNLSGENVYQGNLSAISFRFNKALDVSTLKNNNVGVLWGINDYVPSEISYDKSTYTVTLLLKESIQGGRSTVVVKNVKSESNETINPVTFSIDVALD